MRTLRLLVLTLAAGAAAAQPNILLVYTDDQRSDDVAAMPTVVSRLVAEGTSFTRYIATTPKCGPSRASLLRGQYAHNHGLIGHKNWPGGAYQRWVDTRLGDETIGTWLQAAGYRTAFIGKHQTSFPLNSDSSYTDVGWDEWLVAWTKRTPGTYYGRRFSDNGDDLQTGPDDYVTDVMGARLEAFVRRAHGEGAPFFAVFAPFAPHADPTIRRPDGNVVGPPEPADRHKGAFAGRTGPRYPSFNEADTDDKPGLVASFAPLAEHEVARIDTLYRARAESLLAVDEWVGRVIAVLEEHGTLEDTYIVFASDNGFMLGEHRIRPERKSNMPYREVLELPLIVRGPGIAPGTSTDALAANIDLAPTILEWAGVPAPDHLDGRSLAPVLAGAPVEWRDVILAERWHTNSDITYRSVHSAHAKYTDWWESDRLFEFYNHLDDPYELDNHVDRLAPSLRDSLDGVLGALAVCAGATCREADVVPWADGLASQPQGPVAVTPLDIPTALDLAAPAPNPSRGRATIAYALASPGPRTLSVVDVQGRVVVVLAEGVAPAGEHVATLPAGLAAGVYVVRLQAGGAVLARQAVVVR
ncbi:sulfatase [Rubrivirga sp. IMCC45206]|uniref:sulfatase family protein n=1 Tax=Rubrivirga sp. IMCC45206 TaxID=3391614 RepID=UPI00398FD611